MTHSITIFEPYWADKSQYFRDLIDRMVRIEDWTQDQLLENGVKRLVEAIYAGATVSLSEVDVLMLLSYLNTANAIALLVDMDEAMPDLYERLVSYECEGVAGDAQKLLVERLSVIRRSGLIKQVFSAERFTRIQGIVGGDND